MPPTIEIEDVPSQHVASTRATTIPAEIGQTFGQKIKIVGAFLQRTGAQRPALYIPATSITAQNTSTWRLVRLSTETCPATMTFRCTTCRAAGLLLPSTLARMKVCQKPTTRLQNGSAVRATNGKALPGRSTSPIPGKSPTRSGGRHAFTGL
jgi:hypothetical protein